MKITFEERKGVLTWGNVYEADSLEEAARICVALIGQGFTVIPRDENGVEYAVSADGRLAPKTEKLGSPER